MMGMACSGRSQLILKILTRWRMVVHRGPYRRRQLRRRRRPGQQRTCGGAYSIRGATLTPGVSGPTTLTSPSTLPLPLLPHMTGYTVMKLGASMPKWRIDRYTKRGLYVLYAQRPKLSAFVFVVERPKLCTSLYIVSISYN